MVTAELLPTNTMSLADLQLWLWALLGTLLALVQLLVYAVLARQQSASVTVIWTCRCALLAQ